MHFCNILVDKQNSSLSTERSNDLLTVSPAVVELNREPHFVNVPGHYVMLEPYKWNSKVSFFFGPRLNLYSDGEKEK